MSQKKKFKKKVYSGHFGMDEIDYKYFKVVDILNYGPIISCNPAVVIIPTKLEKENIKFGMIKIYREPISKESWEFPGGGIEEGESPEIASLRELKEETGLYGIPKLIGTFYTAPGKMNYLHHVVKIEIKDFMQKIILAKEEMITDFDFFYREEIFQKVKDSDIISCATLSSLTFI